MAKIILTSRYIKNPAKAKAGKHGLFSFTNDKIDIDEVADEVANHEGILWTHVGSFIDNLII